MRMKFSIAVLLIASLTIFSCSKDNDTTNPDENQSGSLITKMTQGIKPEDDTVFVFNYDADKRIKSVINVSDLDTFEAVFNAAGLVSAVVGRGVHYNGTNTFTYNANNQLIQVDLAAGPYKNKWTFEYTNGVISKKNIYTQVTPPMGTELALFRYITYTVTDGNITSAKEYSSDNTFRSEVKYTYSNEPNVFRPMCLLNWGNTLGADDIASMDAFFNKNQVTSLTFTPIGSGIVIETFTYTYNDKKQLTKVIVSAPGYIATRQFAY